MSKLSKLVNNPELFVKDFIKKKLDIHSSNTEVVNEVKKSVAVKKVAIAEKKVPVKKVESVAKKNVAVNKVVVPERTLITENIALMESYSTLIHCGENAQVGQIHLRVWLNLLSYRKKNVIFLVRNLDLYKKLTTEFPDFNIGYAKTPIDIEALLNIFSIKNICFTSNTANNIHLLRFNNYNHIFIGCFDPMRQPDMHKYLRVYDELWLHSPAKVNEFLKNNSPRHLTVKNIGNPHNNYLFNGNNCVKNILYVPNFKIDSRDSILLDMVNIVKNRNDQKFIFNFFSILNEHSEIFNSAISEIKSLINVVPNNVTNLQLLSSAQAVVCDFNDENLIERFINNNIPVLLYISENSANKPDFLLKIKESEVLKCCYVFSSESEMLDILNCLMQGQDDLKDLRQDYLAEYCGITDDSNKVFKEHFNNLF